MIFRWIRFHKFSEQVASEKTSRFLNLIVDPKKRIYFAEKFLNFDIAIDVRNRTNAGRRKRFLFFSFRDDRQQSSRPKTIGKSSTSRSGRTSVVSTNRFASRSSIRREKKTSTKRNDRLSSLFQNTKWRN